ncbi:MAG: anaerobic ribonucleoside-triphosphate reductase activating protein [Bacillota bacterium]|jgi:pyruvate formate lyase activating enzyme|nr:anaerobic ribonucleoside-triphosphate reductase activating protein [Bacillota bacterium]MDD3298320.1 anaerobic ribonucleoside-triphosphate reductase activating protein [Bacillota bacterium]MDD3851187.1 anaerobic ribonucleoside-triphosphate reductase activating protein [Bacillota bacterium]MDD4706780.1 anaerobic ribonucleoside-triphosphate reductase activating protein [Bacillota bacterium]
MEFLGQVKSSFIDYPDRICVVYFTGGCNFRCPYCHNSPLLAGKGEIIGEDQVFQHLEKRRNMLDGVCVSGGEPTLQADLEPFLEEVKRRGFLVKLDTNGTLPEVLGRLIKNRTVDYIAMDIKAPFGKYNSVAGRAVDIEAVEQSISLIRNAPIEYEFRTTVCRELLNSEDVREIAEHIKGSQRYIVQNFRDCSSVLAGEGKLTPYAAAELRRVKEELSGLFADFRIR